MENKFSKVSIILDKLSSLLMTPVIEEFAVLFMQARQITTDEEMILPNFQDVLETLPRRSIVENEALLERIVRKGKCIWIKDLVKEVIEEMSSSMGQKVVLADVVMTDFLQDVIINVGRMLYRNPIAMYDKFKKNERVEHIRLMRSFIQSAVSQCISNLYEYNDDVLDDTDPMSDKVPDTVPEEITDAVVNTDVNTVLDPVPDVIIDEVPAEITEVVPSLDEVPEEEDMDIIEFDIAVDNSSDDEMSVIEH